MSVRVVILLFSVAFFVGCAKPPREIAEFKKGHPEEYERVIKPELERQESKFALFRSYSNTRDLMVAVEGGVAPSTIQHGQRVGFGVQRHEVGNGIVCFTTFEGGISCLKE